MYAHESALDELAWVLGMDPIELRRKNEPAKSPDDGKPWSSRSLMRAFDEGATRFGWSSRAQKPRATRAGALLIGMGCASGTYPAYIFPASARARWKDGLLVVSSSTHEMGTGTATAQAQLAADVAGLPFERVRIMYGDTDLPPAPVSGGSATTASVGSAVYGAVKALLAKLPEGTTLAQAKGPLEAAYDFKPPEATTSNHAFSAVFVEVGVDEALGIVRIRRVLGAYGAGRILNAKTAASQFRGGIVMGLGMALMEETALDPRFARFVNANLGEYHVPVNRDVPEIEVLMLDERDAHVNAFGAKGVGEIGIVGVAAAVANAVYHATGRRVRDLPITLDKLL